MWRGKRIRIFKNFFICFLSEQSSLVVSVPAWGLYGPSSSLTQCIIFISRNVNHETFRDIRTAWRGVAWGGSRNVSRSVSCSFNAYIGTPISNVSLVYDFLAVTFHSISRKVTRYLGQCTCFPLPNLSCATPSYLLSTSQFVLRYPFLPAFHFLICLVSEKSKLHVHQLTEPPRQSTRIGGPSKWFETWCDFIMRWHGVIPILVMPHWT